MGRKAKGTQARVILWCLYPAFPPWSAKMVFICSWYPSFSTAHNRFWQQLSVVEVHWQLSKTRGEIGQCSPTALSVSVAQSLFSSLLPSTGSCPTFGWIGSPSTNPGEGVVQQDCNSLCLASSPSLSPCFDLLWELGSNFWPAAKCLHLWFLSGTEKGFEQSTQAARAWIGHPPLCLERLLGLWKRKTQAQHVGFCTSIIQWKSLILFLNQKYDTTLGACHDSPKAHISPVKMRCQIAALGECRGCFRVASIFLRQPFTISTKFKQVSKEKQETLMNNLKFSSHLWISFFLRAHKSSAAF